MATLSLLRITRVSIALFGDATQLANRCLARNGFILRWPCAWPPWASATVVLALASAWVPVPLLLTPHVTTLPYLTFATANRGADQMLAGDKDEAVKAKRSPSTTGDMVTLDQHVKTSLPPVLLPSPPLHPSPPAHHASPPLVCLLHFSMYTCSCTLSVDSSSVWRMRRSSVKPTHVPCHALI